MHPRHCPKLTVVCTRSAFADILSAPRHLSWPLRNRFPERHTWRHYQSRTRVSLPPAVCEVVESLLTTLIPISQPECASVLLHRKKAHTASQRLGLWRGEQQKDRRPSHHSPFFAESLFAWNSDRSPLGFWKGGTQQRIHPLCVPGEITLSSATLKLGLSFWNLWG